MRPKTLSLGELAALRNSCGGEVPARTLELAERIAGRLAMNSSAGLDKGHLAIIAELGERLPSGEPEAEEPGEPAAEPEVKSEPVRRATGRTRGGKPAES